MKQFSSLGLGLLLIGLPLLGVSLAGKPVDQYLEFPPLTRYVVHAPFFWPIFVFLAAVSLLLLAALFVLARPAIAAHTRPFSRFPWWGWFAVLLLLVSWLLAWTRFSWFQALQAYTFTPLWLGYILTVNALICRRQGHCLLGRRPRYFLLLFPFSALFWWYFEFLNRFVQNWYYAGIESFGPLEYALHSTLCFSTVLPAVVSTMKWLHTYDAGIKAGHSRHWRMAHIKGWAWLALVASIPGLTGIGIWPDYLFPLLWLVPLSLIVSLQVLRADSTCFAGIARGRWQGVYIPALAALICGFFWEMWNYYSYARWTYTIPFVDRFHIFEMPMLGYAGYILFGLECAVIADFVRRLAAENTTGRA